VSRYLNDDGSIRSIVVRGANLSSELVERLNSADLDYTSDGASQLTLKFRENSNFDLIRNGSFAVGGTERLGSSVDLTDQKFEVASVALDSGDTGVTLTIQARSQGIMHLQRRYQAAAQNNVSPTAWARQLATSKGLRFVGQDSAVLPVVSQNTSEASPWVALQRIAGDLGFIVFEAAGTVYFGQPTWILDQSNERPYRWEGETTTGPLLALPSFRRTGDTSNAAYATVSFTVMATEAENLLPGMRVDLSGVPTFEGKYMVTKVGFSLGPAEVATISAEIPVNPEAKAVASAVSTVASVSAGAGWVNPGAGRYGNVTLNAEQVGYAFTIASVARDRKMTMPRAGVIGIMTAMQESRLRNLTGGDRDSVGLFQQRPSQGWGTVAQCRTPVYAANKFYDTLLSFHKDYATATPLTEVISDVQRPKKEYRGLYAQWQNMAEALVAAMTVNVPAGVGGVSTAAGSGAVASVRALTGSQTLYQIIDAADAGPSHRVTSTTGGTHSKTSLHYKGQAVDFGGPTPSVDSPALDALFDFWLQFAPYAAEIIYAGKNRGGGARSIKNGRVFNYGSSTNAAHHNHVHVGFTPDGIRAAVAAGKMRFR
jgi:hypothetical protein